MKWTHTLIPTLKEDPNDAEVDSHKLMVRSGMIRRLSAGVYSYLPLGIKVLNKVNAIIREEMNAAGSVEILLPALQSLSIFELSGRISVFGNDLLCMTDRHGKEIALSPTHEEVITDLIKNELGSYKNMPLILYQIQTKFRDEARPRFGVLRSREFLMKDAYSFDVDADGLNTSYQTMYDTYCRILSRCQLDYIVVEADTGAMGGDVSHEFMVPNLNGEDVIAKCTKCDYAANLEKAVAADIEPEDEAITEERKEVSTPNICTIHEVSSFLGIEPRRMVKTLFYSYQKSHIAVLVRGDHEVNEAKLAKQLSQDTIELADEKTVTTLTNAPVGFAGPIGLNIHIIADRAVVNMKNCVVGGNKADTHLMNVNFERDFTVDQIADIRFAVEGDKCPKCNHLLSISRGIEIGHVFKLGTRYSKTLGAKYLNKTGKELPIVMGSYGIGINRIIAATIERSHDKDGIVWPMPLAPYEVLVVPVNIKDRSFMAVATKIYDDLCEEGVEVLLDDRDQRPGFKFKDADLIGIPIRITVGKSYKERGELEIKVRSSNEISFSSPVNIVPEVKTRIQSLQ
ncbi:MAG: proline--tRNA ligase [Candidatus Scalindua sp. AMX11]|nr:MAG: proline--tRNA ligase [Candidatus Scalindua sp.]NOG83700.1 proline--tRNA ligase [Planctomycetota bacterium]RZV73850.1 MAG: proline--tRNA ligase [Candidatus Scalindua sp. SCAELEC01]TDE64875.1 MAG: proline--tRNA ligase [Candidatus Scalindua sp. AMX11]GJQ60651.1 MAG: proline--tRNA ligase [Candidatus Scalindua sp.]